MTDVNKERMAIAVAAMRSGRFIKGRGYLEYTDTSGKTRNCCLGVLSRVAQENGWCRLSPVSDDIYNDHDPDDVSTVTWLDSPHSGALPQAVQEAYGLDDDDPELITPDGSPLPATSWNDSGLSGEDPEKDFQAIADGFERTFLS